MVDVADKFEESLVTSSVPPRDFSGDATDRPEKLVPDESSAVQDLHDHFCSVLLHQTGLLEVLGFELVIVDCRRFDLFEVCDGAFGKLTVAPNALVDEALHVVDDSSDVMFDLVLTDLDVGMATQKPADGAPSMRASQNPEISKTSKKT